MNKKVFSSLINSQFFISLLLICSVLLVAGCESGQKKTSLQRILERGYIKVGTLYGSNSYYIGAQGASGFEYELAKKYADYLGVKLEIVPNYSLQDIFTLLENGEVDFLAAGLVITPKRLERFRFSPSYDEISQKLVFKQGNIRPRKVTDLTGSIMVTANSSHAEKLAQLQLQYPGLKWQESNDYDSEELLLKVLNGELNYTVVDSNTLAINRRYYPEISIGFSLTQADKIAWMLPKADDDSLWTSLIEFFGEVHHDGTLLALNDKYYGHIEQFNYVDTRLFIEAIEKKLPQFQPLFEKYSQDVDWRLLAAISYQESHWNPRARSYTGVRGMMMLTLPTAKQMGIKSRLDAEQSIQGGAKYFKQMLERMPARIQEPDRTWFALAAYNIGFGHLNDARIITQQQGGDPDRWFDVKKRLPLLRQKKFYKHTKYGYARGDEPVRYVDNIRRYYHTLQTVVEKRFAKQTNFKETLLDNELTSKNTKTATVTN